LHQRPTAPTPCAPPRPDRLRQLDRAPPGRLLRDQPGHARHLNHPDAAGRRVPQPVGRPRPHARADLVTTLDPVTALRSGDPTPIRRPTPDLVTPPRQRALRRPTPPP